MRRSCFSSFGIPFFDKKENAARGDPTLVICLIISSPGGGIYSLKYSSGLSLFDTFWRVRTCISNTGSMGAVRVLLFVFWALNTGIINESPSNDTHVVIVLVPRVFF
jgi:hypothetical protein